MIFTATHLTGTKTQFKPNQTVLAIYNKKPKQQLQKQYVNKQN